MARAPHIYTSPLPAFSPAYLLDSSLGPSATGVLNTSNAANASTAIASLPANLVSTNISQTAAPTATSDPSLTITTTPTRPQTSASLSNIAGEVISHGESDLSIPTDCFHETYLPAGSTFGPAEMSKHRSFRIRYCTDDAGTATTIATGYAPSDSALSGLYDTHIAHSYIVPYAVAILAWSVIILTGSVMIWEKRSMKAVKIRNWRCILMAVGAIESFMVMCLVEIWVSGLPCQATYWIIVSLFSLSFAASECASARLVCFYLSNKRNSLVMTSITPQSGRGISWKRVRLIGFMQTLHTTIALGVVIEFVLATVLFLGAYRYHITFGLWGNLDRADDLKDSAQCELGFEWVVIVIFPHLWSLAINGFLLWHIRKVRDIYHWSLETSLTIFASIPGPLLYLIFTVLPFADRKQYLVGKTALSQINARIPAVWWTIPGFAAIQGFLVFFPLWNVYRTDTRLAKDRESRIDWFDTLGSDIGMDAMLQVIDSDATRLIDYAAGTRFNAELVFFLREVKKWRSSWTSPVAVGPDWMIPPTPEMRVLCYKHAALIYYKLVCPCTAMFAINITSRLRAALMDVFKDARYDSARRDGGGKFAAASTVTASTTKKKSSSRSPTTRNSPKEMKDLKITLLEADAAIQIVYADTERDSMLDLAVPEAEVDAPETFTLTIFEEAYKEVKRDAYHNIWLPYVKSGRYAQDSKETLMKRHELRFGAC